MTNDIIAVPVNGFSQWWSVWSRFLWPDSDDWIFGGQYNPLGGPYSQLMIMSANKVGQSNYQQYFLDGMSHCVFQPIMNWAIDCHSKAKSESSQKKYEYKTNKIDKLMNEYKEGVPTKDIPDICNQLQIGIQIDLPSSSIKKNTEYINLRSQKKPLKVFKFINTRLNHIELNEITNKDCYEEVSQQELKDIRIKELKSNDFCIWKGDENNGLFQVNTLQQIYKLSQEEGYQKELSDFTDINNLLDFRIEHNSNPQLSEFILDNVNMNQALVLDCPLSNHLSDIFKEFMDLPINDLKDKKLEYHSRINDKNYNNRYGIKEAKEIIEVCDYILSIQNLNHIDLQKAYTRGSDCSFYQGYLGKITDFRRCRRIMGVGIYMIHNIQNIPPLIKKLGILYENNSYPSPELEFYKSLGITFDIFCGCWGSATDINFGNDWNNGMFLKEENGPSYYSKWYGCLMKLSKKERYQFSCKDIEFAQLNNIHENSDIRFNQYKKTGVIEYNKDKCYHSAHIASFIHSYCRISMIEQLLKFKDISQIIAVQVDGIFYKGDVDVGNLFAVKPGKSIKHIQYDRYVINCENDRPKGLALGRKHNLIELHVGPGGAGKTYNNLTDKGLMYPLYVGHSWKLARQKQEEFKIECSVFHYLTSSDPADYLPILRNYNTLIIDEVSTLNDEDKELILKRFKKHKIIFCGDLGYQLPPCEGYEFNPRDIKTFEHTKNKRCECPKLLQILKDLRKQIDKDLFDIDIKQVIKHYRFKIHKKEVINYSVEDLILASTHKLKDYYSQRYKDIEKYRILENSRDYSNGQIIIGSKPDKVKCLLQHAFTIHSIQGETAKNKLFIDINKMNSLRMIYTALSRAKRFDQIYILE